MSDLSKNNPQQGNPDRTADLAEQAMAMGRDIKNKAADLSDTVRRTATDQTEQLTNAAKAMGSEAADRIQSAIKEQKSAGADYIGNFAQAVHRAAGEFQSDVPVAAQYIRNAADHIDSVASAVRDREIGELITEVQQFAARQPTAFFSGAVLLGFAAVRFFKSSTANSSANNKRDAEPAEKEEPTTAPRMRSAPPISPSANSFAPSRT